MKIIRKKRLDSNKVESAESSFEKKLPRDVQRYVFSFFNQQELKNLAQVSKLFKLRSSEEIARLKNQYKDNIFYTVGIPIHISNPKRRPFLDMDLWMKHRENIPNFEIVESFKGKNIQNLKLFKTEHEALEYSRYLRTGDQLLEGTEVFQPALFKVIYLGNIDNIVAQSKDLVINRDCYSSTTDWTQRVSKVNYYETQRKSVIPLEATLKIHLCDLGEFKIHGPIDYAKVEVEQEARPLLSKSCVII